MISRARAGAVAVVAVAVVGCPPGEWDDVGWKRIQGPDPTKWTYIVSCNEHMSRCYEAAAHVCHGTGWRIVNAATDIKGGGFATRSLGLSRIESDGTLLIECARRQAPKKPAPEPKAEPEEPQQPAP